MMLTQTHPDQDVFGTIQSPRLSGAIREPGQRRFDAQIIRLTRYGFRCNAAFKLRPGTLIWLMLPGMDALEAHVMIAQDYRYDCIFKHPLHPAVFDHLKYRYART
jgi:hypothetical protein